MKVLLACTSGGHFATMKGLERFWSRHERVWVTDFKEDTESIQSKERVHWLPYQAPRDFITCFRNIFPAYKILLQEKPDIVISTGASLAVTFAIASKLLGIHFVFIESISRSKELSLSGKIIYPICDELYVQWPALCAKYPKAIFEGYAI